MSCGVVEDKYVVAFVNLRYRDIVSASRQFRHNRELTGFARMMRSRHESLFDFATR